MERQVDEEKVLARLWQDLFQAVESYRKDAKVAHQDFTIRNINDPCSKIFIPQKDIKKVLIMPVMITDGHYTEDAEERQRTRYAVLSALHVAGYQSRNETHIGAFKAEINGEERLVPYEWYRQDTLILQALRNEFPNTIFFTTDLDARLWHTQNYLLQGT